MVYIIYFGEWSGGYMKHSRRALIILLLFSSGLFLEACLGSAPTAPQSAAVVQPTQSSQAEEQSESACNDPMDGPTKVTGSFVYTNDWLTEYYYSEHTVMLFDLTGYVLGDPQRPVPVESQVLGYSEINEGSNNGHFKMQLPLYPQGGFNDVDQSGSYNKGVQIFAISYNPNVYDSPYSAGADAVYGWPDYLASIKLDEEEDYYIVGGQVIVWAESCGESFPVGFGPDGRLFTADDPVQPVAAGYTLVDMNQDPFIFKRDKEITMELYEPEQVALKDYSEMTYAEAFDEMFQKIQREYAFNGIDGKEPNYDALYDDVFPRIITAEVDGDWDAYYTALYDFIMGFRDGHVSIDGGERGAEIRLEDIYFGYGLSVKELDNGDVMVYFVSPFYSSAQRAEIYEGYKILEIDGVPIKDAISNVESVLGPYSSDFAERIDQANLVFRTDEYGKEIVVKYMDYDNNVHTTTLTSEYDSLSYYASFRLKFDNPIELPVEYTVLDGWIGYIRINTNLDDLNLSIRLMERALELFEYNDIDGVILDLRENSGGTPIGIAGLFTDQDIMLATLEYYSEQTGQFEPSGPMVFHPYLDKFEFDKMVTLIGPNCYSACELEAYGLSQVPGMEMIGFYPTAGVEAEVSRGNFLLPDGIQIRVPTGRLVNEDGSIFLEGVGVQPTIRVPLDKNSIYKDDPVLDVAITYILN
jgi:C-terminal processing protease CtpA/Prc